jgi:hypothetical protein
VYSYCVWLDELDSVEVVGSGASNTVSPQARQHLNPSNFRTSLLAIMRNQESLDTGE